MRANWLGQRRARWRHFLPFEAHERCPSDWSEHKAMILAQRIASHSRVAVTRYRV